MNDRLNLIYDLTLRLKLKPKIVHSANEVYTVYFSNNKGWWCEFILEPKKGI